MLSNSPAAPTKKLPDLSEYPPLPKPGDSSFKPKVSTPDPKVSNPDLENSAFDTLNDLKSFLENLGASEASEASEFQN